MQVCSIERKHGRMIQLNVNMYVVLKLRREASERSLVFCYI